MHSRAEELLRCLDPAGALELFDEVLGRSPGDAAALGGRIRAFWLLRRADEAREALASARQSVGTAGPLLVAEGTLALGLRDDWVHLGIHEGSVGRDDEAAFRLFSAAVELDPRDALARRGLVTALRLAGSHDEAEQELTTALNELGPLPGLLAESVWCAVDRVEASEAVLGMIDQGLSRHPDDIELLYARAFLLMPDGDLAEAQQVVELLERLLPRPGVVLHTQAGWLRWVRVTTRPENLPEIAAEAKHRFELALAELPGYPAALKGLALLAADLKESAPDSLADQPETPSILLARASAAERERPLEALELLRRAAGLDPRVAVTVLAEVAVLRNLARYTECRQRVLSALDTWPGHPGLRSQLGWLEFDTDRHERALEIFQSLGGVAADGEVAALRRLGCLDEAEGRAERAISAAPRSVYLLNEYAFCALDRRQYDTAIARFERTLAVAPEDEVAGEQLKVARKFGRRLDRFWRYPLGVSSQTPEDAAEIRERGQQAAGLLPEGTPIRLRGRLSALDRQSTALARWEARVQDSFLNVGLVLGLVWILLSWLLLGLFGVSISLATVVTVVASGIGGTALLIWVMGDWTYRWSLSGLLAVTVAGSGLLSWLSWHSGGHPNSIGLAGTLGMSTASSGLLGMLLVAALGEVPGRARRARLRAADRQAHLVNDLLDLLVLLDYPPALAEPVKRRACLDLLERIAVGQERLLQEPLSRSGRGADDRTKLAFRQHVAGVVAATRDLKRSVLSPGPDTWDNLRTTVNDLLVISCHARWNELPHREPDTVRQVLHVRLLGALRRLLVLFLPPAVLYGLHSAKVLPAAIPLQLQLIAYLGWPCIVLLLWLDPSLATKFDTLKKAADMAATKGQGSPSAGK